MRDVSVATAVAAGVDDGQRALLLLVCSVLVLLMALGAAFFYLRASRPGVKTVLASAGLTAVLWLLGGYGLSFGSPMIPGFLGNPLGLPAAVAAQDSGGTDALHAVAFALFHGAVAILTVTIVAAVVAPHVRFVPWLVFVAVWLIFVYAPIAYSVFNTRNGWLFDGFQLVDQAGGTVVHISAGAALLALFVTVRIAPQQLDSQRLHPQQLRNSGIGVLLLWLGAFGLNVGSEGVVDGLFGTILLNTLIAPAVAAVVWAFTELLMRGRPTLRGAACGAVAGVVAITPACGILTPLWTVGLAVLAGGACAVVVTVGRGSAHRSGPAAVGIHLVGGIIGVAYIGLFGNGVGWKDSGQPTGLADQAGAALGVAVYSFVVTLAIAWALHKSIGLRRDTVREAIESLGA